MGFLKTLFPYADFSNLFQCRRLFLLLRHLVLATIRDELARKNTLTKLGWQFLWSYDIWCFCHVTDKSFCQITLHHVIITRNIIKCKHCNLKWLPQFKTICYFVSSVCYQFTKLRRLKNKQTKKKVNLISYLDSKLVSSLYRFTSIDFTSIDTDMSYKPWTMI